MTANMEFAFPTVAIIRKGSPKRKTADGKETVGKDLQDKLRIAWQPGTEMAQLRWQEIYGSETIVKEIRAMLPFPKVWDCLQIWNEAYQAGRMVVRANDKQVIVRRDPTNGKYLVRDGEPFEEYIPGQPVTYQRGDKTFTLPVRTSIRLRLFLHELGLPVQFVLKSTSYYDAVNLRQQMGAIQLMADMLNNGIAGGIPIILYRQSTEVTWNKKDGSAARVPHWLINVMVDERWIKAATQRMSSFALTGEKITGLLQPPAEIAGSEDPGQGSDDPEEEPELIAEGEYREETEPDSMDGTPPEEPPHPVEETQSSPAPEPAAARAKLAPEQVRERLLARAQEWKQKNTADAPALRKLVQRIAKDILDGTAIHAQETPDLAANTLLFYLTGFKDYQHIEIEYIRAIKSWLKPQMADNELGYEIDETARAEALNCYRQAAGLELE